MKYRDVSEDLVYRNEIGELRVRDLPQVNLLGEDNRREERRVVTGGDD